MRLLLLPVLLLALLLAACDAREARDFGRSLGNDLDSRFSTATREEVPGKDGASTFTLSIESFEEATWVDAMMAIAMQNAGECQHGGSQSTEDWSPPLSQEEPHPAGTLFTQTIRCPGRLPGEFEVDAGAGIDTIAAQVEAQLTEGRPLESPNQIVMRVGYNTRFRKYDAINHFVGSTMQRRVRDCAGRPVTLERLVIAAWPPGPRKHGFSSADMVIGMDLRCAPADPEPSP